MGIFNTKPDISKYNLINKDNALRPYDLSMKKVYFELYLSPDADLCIVGKLDNNYIAWCSLTKLSDKEINERIFDHVASSEFKIFSNEYNALGKELYEKVSNWYRSGIERSSLPGYSWQTPFGHYYGNSREDHGKNFSRDICTYFDTQIQICKFRICEGSYADILMNYFEILTKEADYSYYYKMQPLISILEAESYLRLCPDASIRDLYLKCMRECSSLYNRYMSAVR